MAAEQACAYAALLLNDCGKDSSAENIAKVLAAAGIEARATIPIIFAHHLATEKSVASYMDAAAEAPVAAAPAAAGGAAGAAPAAGKKDEKKVEEEEGDDDMGFGLFD